MNLKNLYDSFFIIFNSLNKMYKSHILTIIPNIVDYIPKQVSPCSEISSFATFGGIFQAFEHFVEAPNASCVPDTMSHRASSFRQ